MKQKQALDILKAGKNVYITGPAGSGKTYVLREYIEYLKNRDIGFGITASTGIAATHIGGVTIHSWSGIGIREFLSPSHIEELIQKEYLYKRYKKTQVLIIDEISMLSATMLDSLDRLCQAMKQSAEPFGGMQIVLSGDFFQLPPISRDTAVQFAYKSQAWKQADIRICYLDEQWRQREAGLQNILLEIRAGEISDESRELLAEQATEKDFGHIIPTRLFTHNRDVDVLNEKELEKIDGEVFEYYMHSKGRASLVEGLRKSILAPEVLRLKKNATVMFVKNNVEAGYVNGTIGTVIDFDQGVPIVKTKSGNTIEVEETEWSIEENDKVLAQVTQLPLRLAWAITVHKSQGMTLDAAEIDLSEAFVPGQGYVALSRLRDLDGLVLRGINEMSYTMDPEILALDGRLMKQSDTWEKVIARFTEEDMKKMHGEFIVRMGGTLDEEKIAENAKVKRKDEPVISTYTKTKKLIEEGLSIKDISTRRGMTMGTIISHIEKLIELHPDIDIERYKPKAANLKKIKKAFAEAEDTKLAPVFGILKGKFSYEDIRLARLFLK